MINNLAKFSLLMSLLGILFLIILTQQLPIKVYPINQIDETLLNQRVAINASVLSINDYGGFQTIFLKDDTGTIKAISFSKKELKKSDKNWIIIGTIKRYKDELEIEIEKIKEQ